MQCRIAVVQCRVRQLDVKQNLHKMEMYIAKAAKTKADIVVFPEDAIAGWIVDRPDLADYHDKYRAHFQLLAKKYRIAIVPGSIREGDAKGIYNTNILY